MRVPLQELRYASLLRYHISIMNFYMTTLSLWPKSAIRPEQALAYLDSRCRDP